MLKITNSTEDPMEIAIKEAKASADIGEVPVGAVIVNENGKIISRSGNLIETLQDPTAHAEILSIRAAAMTLGTWRLTKCDIYVTLEPCSHYGKTGPCAMALIDAGVSRVVVACEDPNPLVSGKGIKLLEEAGIGVDVGLLEDQARALNQGFIKRCEHGLPWVTIKMASSIDGRTAMASGQSQWVTTPDSRKDVQKLRAKSCAIITGIGTQMMDDPSLTVRISEQELGIADKLTQPLRVVVDSRLLMKPSARMLDQGGKIKLA